MSSFEDNEAFAQWLYSNYGVNQGNDELWQKYIKSTGVSNAVADEIINNVHYDIIAQIKKQLANGDFSHTECRIATFIINNVSKTLELSISEIARSAHTSPAAITRFVHAIGCKDIRHLRSKLTQPETHAFIRKVSEQGISKISFRAPPRYAAMLDSLCALVPLTDKGCQLFICLDEFDLGDVLGIPNTILLYLNRHLLFSEYRGETKFGFDSEKDIIKYLIDLID